MRDFMRYLAARVRPVLFLAAACAAFAAIFALCSVPVMAAVYPAVLSLALWLVLCAAGYLRTRRALAALRGTGISEPSDALPSPEGPVGEEYRSLCLKLAEARTLRETRSAEAMERRMAYFTVWTHEIKTPIAAMNLRLQNEDSALARELRADLGRVEQYADMALAYLRLDSPGDDLVIRETSLDSVVHSAVRKFAGEFILRGIRLDCAELHKTVLTDEKWLGFIVGQIVSNSLKYTKAGTVSIYMDGEDTLVIRDTGIGIAPEDLPRIFDNGYTGQTGRAYSGSTGLGLWLTKRAADMLGHRIEARSEVGVGTEMRLWLGRPEEKPE